MNELTAENLEQFRQHFGTIHDGLIFGINFLTGVYSDIILVTIGCRYVADPVAVPRSTERVNLELQLRDVVWFNLRKQPNYDSFVISKSGVKLFDGLFHFDFLGLPEDFDYINNPNHVLGKGSGFYVITKKIFWQIKPFQRPTSWEY